MASQHITEPEKFSRIFTLEDQKMFALISGDYNPLHIDPVVARRVLHGEVIVHGVHSLLWALNCWLHKLTEQISILRLNATFLRPVFLHEEVWCTVHEKGSDFLEIEIVTDRYIATKIRITWNDGPSEANSGLFIDAFPDRGVCRDVVAAYLANAEGELKLYLKRTCFETFFPSAARCLPPLQVAEILATTRLVGMQCPGLHSVFHRLDISFSSPVEEEGGFSFEAQGLDERFNLLSINICGPAMEGTIKALIRPVPRKQARFREIKKLVDPDEFAGQRALIIGGSRGVGEVATKILAAGGSDVRFSYYLGKEDAFNLVEEICKGGGRAACLQLDVQQDQGKCIEELTGGWKPTHMYYFATPYIAAGKKDTFSTQLLSRFIEYFVNGFAKIFYLCNLDSLKGVFYPSTVFVAECPADMNEYVAAKMAGEALCEYLTQQYPQIKILKPRLSKLSTDQTNSVLRDGGGGEPIEIILPHLRKMSTCW